MKKIILLVSLLLAVCVAKADDLQYMTQQQAISTLQLLQNHKYVLLYCSCCAGEKEMRYVKLKRTYCQYTGYEEYYQVFVEGVDQNGNVVSEPIDLAYSYIKKKKKAACIGLELNYFCMPCDNNVLWGCKNF